MSRITRSELSLPCNSARANWTRTTARLRTRHYSQRRSRVFKVEIKDVDDGDDDDDGDNDDEDDDDSICAMTKTSQRRHHRHER